MERRIEEQLSQDQYGFRKGKGTREAILGLRQIQEKQVERQKCTFFAFVDLEKAFDSLNWQILFPIMDQAGLDFKDKRLVYNLYRLQEAEVRINNTRTSAKIKKGVRQGCTLSPPLFNLYIEEPIKELKTKLGRWEIGVKIGGKLISMIRFADDIVLMATSERDLERALEEMKRIFENYHLKINRHKTKVMAFDKQGEIPLDIQIDNLKLQQVSEYKYLGSTIKSRGTCTKEIRYRIAQAKAAFLVRKKLLCSKSIKLNIKKRLVRTYVWSVALYGCETWTLNKAEEHSLEAFEMWCWRKMERISYVERKTNEDVLRLVNEPRTMLSSIKRRRWKMMGHSLRHGEELHTTIIEGMIEGKRGVGRPRTSYLSQLLADAGVARFSDLKRMANDRMDWRRRGFML
jgi:hypothetical protein